MRLGDGICNASAIKHRAIKGGKGCPIVLWQACRADIVMRDFFSSNLDTSNYAFECTSILPVRKHPNALRATMCRSRKLPARKNIAPEGSSAEKSRQHMGKSRSLRLPLNIHQGIVSSQITICRCGCVLQTMPQSVRPPSGEEPISKPVPSNTDFGRRSDHSCDGKADSDLYAQDHPGPGRVAVRQKRID